MKLNSKICSDPKHLAWATWTLLSNNPVNKITYLLFCFLDFIILLIYSFTLVQRVHYRNQTNQPILENQISNTTQPQTYTDSENLKNQSYGISLGFLREFDIALYHFSNENNLAMSIFSGIIFGVVLLIWLTIFILAIKIRDHQGLEKSNLFKKLFTFFLVCIFTFLKMPIFDIIVRTLVFTNDQSIQNQMSLQILRYAIGIMAAISFVILMIYLQRIFTISIPSQLIPWCGPISKISLLSLLFKALIVICLSFDIEGDFTLIEISVLFILFILLGTYRILFAPSYLKEIDMIIKTKDFAISLVFLIGIVCKVVTDISNYDLIYFIIFLPIITWGWMELEKQRKESILVKLKTKQLKLELEYEYALYVTMTLVRDCMEETITSQNTFGQLLDLALIHLQECEDDLCICQEMDNFFELLKLRNLHNSEIFPLLRQERKKYKKIIDEQGLIGTISSLTELVLKTTNSSLSTVTKQNCEDIDRLAMQESYEHHFNKEPQQQDFIKQSTDSKNGDEKDYNSGDSDVFSNKTSQKEQQTQYQKQINKKKSQQRIYKINIDIVKKRFLSELLYLFYFEIRKKFPDSIKLQLLNNYFTLHYKQKDMLCIFQMRSFNYSKLSKLDQCCHLINEQYLLSEIRKIQRSQLISSQTSQDGNFNGEYFIKMTQLYEQMNLSIETLSTSVVTFWKEFQKQTIDVVATQNMGTSIAGNIHKVFKTFQELDSIKLFKDYQMYFQFAIVQLHILNDPIAYDLYISKMRSILEINKVYQKNFTNNKISDHSNFVIVDANGSKFGNILQMNNGLRHLIGWSEEQVHRFTIDKFMPKLIRNSHDKFVERYNRTGQSYIINNKMTMFLKKANGYVIPVEIYIKFHYSIDYQYTFLALIKPFYEMSPFQNGVKYNTNQLIFLVVDNDDGAITEYSESCKELLGFNQIMEQDGIQKNIHDLIQNFDFQILKQSRQYRYIMNEIYESMHELNLKCFSEAQSDKQIMHESEFNLNNLKITTTAKTRVFEERYSGGVLDMNIFCFCLNNDNDASSMNKSNNIMISQSLKLKIEYDDFQKEINNESVNDKNIKVQQDTQSQTGSSHVSSTTSMVEFRNFHSFNQQNTPQSLKIIIQLILTLYIIIITVASVNLGINITRQYESENDVHTVRQSFERMTQLSMNQLLVRVLLNIANGYEPENSILVSKRYDKYREIQEARIYNLKDAESYIERSSFKISDKFQKFLEDKNVKLYYLNDQNQPYVKEENLAIAVNLYIAKLTELSNFKKFQLKGNLRVQNIQPKNESQYKPSDEEQLIYFIVENGNKQLLQYVTEASSKYSKESQNHSQQNIVSTKVTTIISVVTILIIGLIIAPILTKAEVRKYQALSYFLKLPKEIFDDLILNCEYCMNMSQESRYYEIQSDYEKILGVQLINQQIDQLKQIYDQKDNIANQQSIQSEYYSNNNSAFYNYPSKMYSSYGSEDNLSPNVRKGLFKLNSYNIDKKEVEQFEEPIIQNEDELQESQDGKNKKKSKIVEMKLNQDNDQRIKEQQQVTEEDKYEKEINQKQLSINQRVYKRRITVIFASLSIIVLLSFYFVIAYFMAMQTFQTASDVINTLEIIFYKGSCFDSTMNFLRENQIRNQTIMYQNGESAVQYYLDLCLEKEQSYKDLRVKLPIYLQKVQGFIETIESQHLCDQIYNDKLQGDQNKLCKHSLKGIMDKGLTNAFYYMYQQILKANLKFNSLGVSKQRNYTALHSLVEDQDLAQIIDVKVLVLDTALNQLKYKSMESVILYIQKLLQDFIVAFVVFTTLLTIGVASILGFGFKILRRSMWDTNMILKLIPFESLPREERIEIKDFFKK